MIPIHVGKADLRRNRNLRALVDAIKLHTCEYIAEFNPREFDPPADSDAPPYRAHHNPNRTYHRAPARKGNRVLTVRSIEIIIAVADALVKIASSPFATALAGG